MSKSFELDDDLYQALVRQDLTTFIHRSFGELNPTTELHVAPYVEVIASKLEAVRRGEIKRLIINLPPRSLKSHCASIVFPAWLLGHDPTLNIICASYGKELSDKLARDTRTLMQSRMYQRLFPTRLSGRLAVHDFGTTEGGGRYATSVGGALTGRGADVVIIDDPQKPDEAMSEAGRAAVNDWFDNTLQSRLNSKRDGCIIMVMQRLHLDDLVGHVAERGKWEILSLPAIAIEYEEHVIESPFGRKMYRRTTGELLHPERDSAETLAVIRETIGSYNFSAQYQQTPIPIGGNIIKTDWLRYYDTLPDGFMIKLLSIDTASKSGELNDYSAMLVWGLCDDRYYLLDVVRQRLNYPDLKRRVIDIAKAHQPDVVLIEDKGSGTALIQDLDNEGVYGVKAYEVPAGSDKTMRLHAQSAVFEAGNIVLPREAPWLDTYINEVTGFPGGRHDDQVDATTQALDYLRQHERLHVWIKAYS